MDDGELGKRRIEGLMASLAQVQGLDPKQILFKWNLEGMVLQEHEIQLDEKVYVLKICLGDKLQTITFSISLVQKSVNDPKLFLLAYESYIVATLRRLKRRAGVAPGHH